MKINKTVSVILLLGLTFSLVWNGQDAQAQFRKASESAAAAGGCTLGEPAKLYWECGLKITARRGGCRNVVATVPCPVDWPEQKVKVVEERFSPYARVDFKKFPGGSTMMNITIASLPAGETAEVVAKFEVENYTQLAPEKTKGFRAPNLKELPKTMKMYLMPSPKIESKDKRIVKLADTIGKDAPNAWAEVEAVYDWVQKEIQYQNGELKGAVQALEDKTGDCEELSSLFIAICRAKGIPARIVWVPEHCYAEFYLEGKDGVGHWFPCQPAGDKAFGEMPLQYIILQKGDCFTLKFDNPAQGLRKGEKVRYMPEEVRAMGSGAAPSIQFIASKVAE